MNRTMPCYQRLEQESFEGCSWPVTRQMRQLLQQEKRAQYRGGGAFPKMIIRTGYQDNFVRFESDLTETRYIMPHDKFWAGKMFQSES